MPAVYDPEQLDEKERNASDSPESNAPDSDDLYKKETTPDNNSPHENTVGEGYKPGGSQPSLRSRLIKGRGRKAAIGGSLAALLIAGAIALFVSLIPLKILHIVNNLQSRFYATTQNAVEKEVDQLFSGYVRGKILKECRGVYIDSSCNPYDGSSFVKKLYRGWSDGRLEEKLRSQTGLEIRYNQNSKIYEMKFNDNDIISVEDLKNNKTITEIIDAKGDWTEVKKNHIRSVYKSALKGTTRHQNAMYYMKVTPYLKKKYGIKWCVIGCDKKDDFRDWKKENIDDRKFGAKMWLAERVLGPRAELYKLIMECLYSPSADCDRDKVIEATKTSSTYSADVNGCKSGCRDNDRRVSETVNEMEGRLASIALSFGSDHASLRKTFDRFEKSGFTTAIFQSLLSDARIDDEGDARGNNEFDNNKDAIDKTNEEGEKKRGFKPVRVVGWMLLASQAIDFINESPDIVARMQYVTNSSAMTQMWGMYRTAADEMKEGETDAGLIGSFVTSLGPGLQPVDGSSGDVQVGGTSGAEASPLYEELISSGANSPAGIASIISPSALAAEPVDNGYLCSNNEPVPVGQLICSEEQLTGKTRLNTLLDPIRSLRGWQYLASAADALNDIVDGIIGKILGWIGKLPFVGRLLGAISDLAAEVAEFANLEEVFTKFAQWMLGANLGMVSNNMSGGRTFNLIAGGADVSGNDFAHHGIGGVALKPEQIAQNIQYAQQTQLAEYRQKSFYARMTDTESPYSPIGKLALATPTSTTAFANSVNNAFATFLKNPFGKIADTFASLVSSRVGAAGFIPGKDPFGVTQYGYPLDDPVFKADPDEYWKNYCTDTSPFNLTKTWNAYAADNLNPENFEPENPQTSYFANKVPGNVYGTNGCLLIQAAVGSAGAIFTDDVLSAEELAELQPEPTGGIAGPVDCSATSGVDQSPGTPAKYADEIAAAAEGLTCPDYPKPDGAFPSTPGKQYMAYDGCSDGCAIQGTKDGRPYIRVKYRNPPLQGNTIDVFVNP